MEHLIRMRERLDEHSRFLESQLAGLECMIQDKQQLGINFNTNPVNAGESSKDKVAEPNSITQPHVTAKATFRFVEQPTTISLPPPQVQSPFVKSPQLSISRTLPVEISNLPSSQKTAAPPAQATTTSAINKSSGGPAPNEGVKMQTAVPLERVEVQSPVTATPATESKAVPPSVDSSEQ